MVTRKDILKEAYQMACHNLFCYSKNYGMTIPKDGCEKEFEKHKSEVEVLQEWLKELQLSEQENVEESDWRNEQAFMYQDHP